MTEAIIPSGGLFDIPRYPRVWLSGLVYYLAFWFEIIVGGWIVLELTVSAFSVGLLGFFQMGPMLIFGLLLETVADQMRRPDLLLIARFAGLLASSVLVSLGTIAGILVMLVAIFNPDLRTMARAPFAVDPAPAPICLH